MTTARIKLERVYQADLQDVWDLWTTKEGIESWWGPGGFAVTVRTLDLRPGGSLLYAMTRDRRAADRIHEAGRYAAHTGVPHHVHRGHSAEATGVHPSRRLHSWRGSVPDVATIVELDRVGESVRMVLWLDPMHNEEWTNRAVMGWNSELDKLGALILSRSERHVSEG